MELAFQSDAIAGTSRQPVIFRGEELIFQELDLHQGWNWISLNVTGPAMNDVEATLSNGLWQEGDIIQNVELGFQQPSVRSVCLGCIESFNNRSLFYIRPFFTHALSHGDIPVGPA